jgi:peptide/nickel transport system substrate-binding protein
LRGSLKRWGKSDNMGQKLMDFTASTRPPTPRPSLKLKKPYGLVLSRSENRRRAVHAEANGGNAGGPVIKNRSDQALQVRGCEFQPGVKAVARKRDYVPRKEPAS